MGFFDKFKKKAEPAPLLVAADAKGTVVRMESIPDDVFAQGILGQCCGIDPSEGKVYAPCDGTIKQVVAAKGASVNSGDPLIVIG